MPSVYDDGKYRIFFYSDEGTESLHVHVESAEKRAKLWLDPIELEWNAGFRSGELKEIRTILQTHQKQFIGAWNAHFGI